MRKLFVVSLILMLAGIAPAIAQQKGEGGPGAVWTAAGPVDTVDTEGVPDSMLNLDITGIENWDAQGDPDNTVLIEVLGPGAVVTGVGYDVTITTFGASWLSEATTTFGNDGGGVINLAAGTGDDMSGTASYSSGGIIDFSDNALPNITVGADDALHMEFWESFVDNDGAADSVYDPTSTYDIAGIGFGGGGGAFPIPTLSTIGLIALLTALAGGGIFLLRR